MFTNRQNRYFSLHDRCYVNVQSKQQLMCFSKNAQSYDGNCLPPKSQDWDSVDSFKRVSETHFCIRIWWQIFFLKLNNYSLLFVFLRCFECCVLMFYLFSCGSSLAAYDMLILSMDVCWIEHFLNNFAFGRFHINYSTCKARWDYF